MIDGRSESLFTGLNAIDEFAWIGSFSAGGLSTDYDANLPGSGRKLGRPRSEANRRCDA